MRRRLGGALAALAGVGVVAVIVGLAIGGGSTDTGTLGDMGGLLIIAGAGTAFAAVTALVGLAVWWLAVGAWRQLTGSHPEPTPRVDAAPRGKAADRPLRGHPPDR